ncbi:hypothetical protein L2E82_40968 [Cichorium intybus]|uniref:Uncharacterized protein n=1 Tax=Cichorium intybus TaxID=13427 RepID=A0ACB9AN32_CICIN|nr:hypothetical protein L2E82_40968 [Cichorium intybus]
MQSRFQPAQSTDAAEIDYGWWPDLRLPTRLHQVRASCGLNRTSVSNLPRSRQASPPICLEMDLPSLHSRFLVISGCKEFSPTNNTHCNRRLYIASCLRLSVPVRSCRTQISLSISI